jgi:hypothetical protein
MLAATLAFAAAFGSLVGAVSGSGLVQFIAPPRPAAATDNTIAATQQMKAELAEISAIKASLENATRVSTSQYTKIADRLDQLDRRTASAPADVTGSLAGGARRTSRRSLRIVSWRTGPSTMFRMAARSSRAVTARSLTSARRKHIAGPRPGRHDQAAG